LCAWRAGLMVSTLIYSVVRRRRRAKPACMHGLQNCDGFRVPPAAHQRELGCCPL
jgi:hypothetical protein